MPVRPLFFRLGRWLNLPAGLLAVLLQRTPALRVTAEACEHAVVSRAGEILRAAVAASALGAMHSLAGATTYVQNPPNPVSGTVGTRVSVAFTFIGAPSDPQYWMILGGQLPPGLSFVPAPVSGTIRTRDPAITGIPTQGGSYSVRVQAIGLAGQSDPVDIRFQITGEVLESRLNNLSVRTTLAAEQPLIVGFVVAGGERNILVRAAGPALANFGLADAMPDPRLELYDGSGVKLNENDNWPATLATTFSAVGAFAFTTGSRDSAMLQSVAGNRSVVARGTAGGVVLVEAYDTGTGNSPRLVNVSARNRVGTGDNILIAGFNIAGNTAKQLLIRAVGPSLAAFGVPGVLANPKLELYSGAGAKLNENDDWAAALTPTFAAVGAFPLDAGSRDAALLVRLNPGAYSAQVSGVANATGEALVEVYEVP